MYISLVSDCEVNKSVTDASFSCALLNCSFCPLPGNSFVLGTSTATAIF